MSSGGPAQTRSEPLRFGDRVVGGRKYKYAHMDDAKPTTKNLPSLCLQRLSCQSGVRYRSLEGAFLNFSALTL